MTSAEIRQDFFDFFASKGHVIVPSAPIVAKDDPTLMFTNAGMNQFKDYFLGNKKAPHKRIADTQKCLRVSGKHNDLEEVGVDTYHHTMFEMLGNWSFGDYFKKEAIAWSWELLTEVYKIPKDRLYVTVFEGDTNEKLPRDEEAAIEWKKWISEDRILMGSKKDNFWEMGDTGPCGPCTEIHVDCRDGEERKKTDGKTLVNAENPEVIEIWNNVFIQFNRLKDGTLEPLPQKHVDTGMGFERLVRILQNKTSNYDTDIFTGIIDSTEKITGKHYDGSDSKEAVAFRVIADHVRAVSFTIADGQLPSNTGAGYVIRRILRRAVRYYFTYFDHKTPLIYQLVSPLAEQFKTVFPDLHKQVEFVKRAVRDEEETFLKTIDSGTRLFNEGLLQSISKATSALQELGQNYKSTIENASIPFKSFSEELSRIQKNNERLFEGLKSVSKSNLMSSVTDEIKSLGQIFSGIQSNFEDIVLKNFDLSRLVSGSLAFKLQDTYGFPIDLTRLMAREVGTEIDEVEFEKEMKQQKNRSRESSIVDTEDWVVLNDKETPKFVGYDSLEVQTKVVKYRKIKSKGNEAFQLVLAITPFYAESGGQVGDTGELIFDGEEIHVTNTKRESNLIIHFTEKLPVNITAVVSARVNRQLRRETAVHHTATHLLHSALRTVLGKHVVQKGSLVSAEYLRFDFSHFSKVNEEELRHIESLVNEKIRANIPVVIREMKKDEAISMGAMALFGEKYGDTVRVVIIDPNWSIELCGGTHVANTGELGFFKITMESAIAAGVRRIEAVSGLEAEKFVTEKLEVLSAIRNQFKNPRELLKATENLFTENSELKKKLDHLENRMLVGIRNELLQKDEIVNGITFVGEIVPVSNAEALKKLCFDLKNNLNDYMVVLCANIGGKPSVAIGIDDKVVEARKLDAGKIIKEHVAPLIKGGGGGQKNLATAGGQDAGRLQEVIEKVKSLLE